MQKQIVIVWGMPTNFDYSKIDDLMTKLMAQEKKPPSDYLLKVWRTNGLTINLFERKLVVQGKLDVDGARVIREISRIEGLRLDEKNAKKLAAILPIRQNAVICAECRTPSLLIKASISGLDVAFVKECGHKNNMRPPFLVLNNRVQPDINILVAKALSRLIDLGFFVGFEIVLPQYVMNAIDFLGKKQKHAVSDELQNLQQLAVDGKIKIMNYKDGLRLPNSKEDFQKEEDNAIINISDMTNAVLITSDENVKNKAILANRPTVFIPARFLGELKILEDVRSE